jgi:hypothetical protein
MNDKNSQEAAKLFHRAESAPTVNDYEKEQLAIRANYGYGWLKAERLAREADQDRR